MPSSKLPASIVSYVIVSAALSGQQTTPPGPTPVPSTPATSTATATIVVPGQPTKPQNPAPAPTPAAPAAGVTVVNGEVVVGQDPSAQNAQGGAAAPQLTPEQLKAQQEAQKKQEELQKKQQRLQKLQQVQFDRRSSTILRTWSMPPGSDDVAPPEGANPAEGQPGAPPNEAAAMQQLAMMSAVPQPVAMPAAEGVSAGESAPGAPVAAGAAPAGPDGKPAAPPKDPFDQALKQWRRDVTLSNWAGVKSFLANLATEDEKKAAWLKLYTGLRTPPPAQGNPQNQQFAEQNVFSFDDVVGIAAAAPVKLDDKALQGLGALAAIAIARGCLPEALVARMQAEVGKPETERALDARQSAKVAIGAGQVVHAGTFLPKAAEAEAQKDHEGLNLIARVAIARFQKEAKTVHLEEAWAALQAIFASGEIEKAHKDEALKAAVGLAPKIRAELGKTWLTESFTKNPQRGMEIIAAIGSAASTSLQTSAHDAALRLQTMQLQGTAVEGLLAAAPERGREWRPQLDLLANNWLKEAMFSYTNDYSTSLGPMMRRDRYGNFFYYDDEEMQRRFQGQGQGWNAIKTADVLDLQPSDGWLAQVDPAQQPKYAMVKAQLLLKVKEDEKAFPHIAQLAATHPPQAKELVNEFLRVWTSNHDPNEARNQGRAYWMYGYEPRAEGIPLTRSKQNRNLEELGRWIGRIKGLGLGDPDEQLLAKAFTTCHSSAEVYRTEAIEAVFGNLAQIKPKTLAALAQQMRANLGGLWRLPAVQDRAKTKRKPKDIMQEVLRGYQVAGEVVGQTLQKFPDDWSLLLAGATIGHDLNNYHRELARDTKFSERRELTFELFAQAAQAYAKKVGEMPRDEESTAVYEHWFYAALGASDLAAVTEETVPNAKEVEQIKAAIDALPGDAADRHRGRFANTLFTRMSAAKPPVKFRYLKYGFEIVGAHKQAYEARKVFDYYKDLVTEIKLQVQVDGADTVGTEQPFGVFVSLLHTREIERESGGFGRYLQNQASMSYAYNYGRPPENYRDKFSEAARQALGEHFEVLSVTFQQETVTSRATAEYGWRVTPYAYLLLKPRGPQVDHIPPLRFDLDFMDTSGYAVLPIESPKVPVDASRAGPPRPARGVEVTQILDERQAKDGKLLLEVKATARGLVPDLASLLAVAPAGFAIDKTEDSGVQVSRFDPDAEGNTVVSERTWNLTLKGNDGLPELPRTFSFGEPRADDVKMLRQRYVDADLVTVDSPEIGLEGRYGRTASTWPWFVAIGAVVCGLLGFLFVSRRRRPTLAAATGLQMPRQITPFTVLGLLRAIGQEPALDAATRGELDATIGRIERHFFGKASGEGLDLQSVARSWLERTQQRAG